MKRFLSMGVFLVATSVMLSGCIKVEDTMIINKDDSAQYKVAMLFDKRLEPFMGNEMDDSIKEAESKESDDVKVKVEKVNRGDYFGYEVTKDIKNILDLSMDQIGGTEAKIISNNENKQYVSVVEKNLFKKVYRIDADIDLTDLKSNSSFSELDSQTASMFSYSTKIQIPGKAISTNSTIIDEENNIYAWDVKFFQKNPIKLEWVIYNEVNIAVAIMLVLMAIVAAVVAVVRKRK